MEENGIKMVLSKREVCQFHWVACSGDHLVLKAYALSSDWVQALSQKGTHRCLWNDDSDGEGDGDGDSDDDNDDDDDESTCMNVWCL